MTSSLTRLLAATLAIATIFAAPQLRAQDAPRADRSEVADSPPAGPATATASTTIDDHADLAAEQRAAEGEGQPDATRPPAPNSDERPADSKSHRYQLGLRIGAGGDARFAIKYGTGPSCGMAGEAFCRRLGTGLIDVELAFGLSDTAEISVLGRFGLAEDAAAQARPTLIGLGIRAYGSPHSMTKLFFGARAMLDFTSSEVAGYSSVDIGARGEFGLIVDVSRYLGIYAQLGVGIHFLNALNFIGDLTGGIQARIP